MVCIPIIMKTLVYNLNTLNQIMLRKCLKHATYITRNIFYILNCFDNDDNIHDIVILRMRDI